MTNDNENILASSPSYSVAYKAWFLFLLVLIYACSFLDRIITAVVAQPMKIDLGLTDFQVGLLGGLAFALLYTFAGIPLGRLAESRRRVRIITVCIVAWSAFAALCGTAQNFWQMVFLRAGVGVGEAGGTPSAHSLIADHFAPARRATALSIYALGVPVGVLAAAFGGGWVAQHLGWRLAFMVLGVPGLALGLLALLTLREPPRGFSEGKHGSVSAEVPSFVSVIKRLWQMKGARHMIIAIGIGSFAVQAINQFIPIYIARVFGLGVARAGFTFGVIVGVGGFIGIGLGGTLADWLAPRDKRWYAWVPGLATVIAVPLGWFAFQCDRFNLAIPAIFLFSTLVMTWNGPTFAVAHGVVGPRMRASATVVVLMVMSLVGAGLGPAAIGFASDWFAARVFSGAGNYLQVCLPHALKTPALALACAQASASGIRSGMLSFSIFLAWAAGHYLWASHWMRQQLPLQPLHSHHGLVEAVAEAES